MTLGGAIALSGCSATLTPPEAAAAPDMASRAAFGAMAEGAPAPAAMPQAPGSAPGSAGRTAPASEPSAQLLYEATITMGVYQVSQAMDGVMDVPRLLGGHVISRDDLRIAFRVPRARFDEALKKLEGIGDVIHRDIHAEDVSDQYRDLEVRLKNARAMRDRLEQLLSRANTVEDSLKIENQLSRITEEIERLSGALALLGHRVEFSKITVLFEARHADQVRNEPLRLPFTWLGTLGLSHLLQLKE